MDRPRREDENQIAARILRRATEGENRQESIQDILTELQQRLEPEQLRQLAAAILGSEGGKKGGRARAESMSKERRSAIARKAAQARWGKQEKS